MAKDEGTRKTDEAYVISLTPDVCLTPMGSDMVPVPYPIIARFDTAVATAKAVRFGGCNAFHTGSYLPTVTGDEAGVGGGIRNGSYKGRCHPITHSTTVRTHGEWVVRHGDMFKMNCKCPGNTTGKAIYIKVEYNSYVTDSGEVVIERRIEQNESGTHVSESYVQRDATGAVVATGTGKADFDAKGDLVRAEANEHYARPVPLGTQPDWSPQFQLDVRPPHPPEVPPATQFQDLGMDDPPQIHVEVMPKYPPENAYPEMPNVQSDSGDTELHDDETNETEPADDETDTGGLLNDAWDYLKPNDVHDVLDYVGYIPAASTVASVANAGLYAWEGDWKNAAWSAVDAIPFAKWLKKAGKTGKRIAEGLEALDGIQESIVGLSARSRKRTKKFPKSRRGVDGIRVTRKLTQREIGRLGERHVRESLERRGYKVMRAIQNPSNHGLDVVARDPHGKIHVFEVKTNTKGYPVPLTERQEAPLNFVLENLAKASEQTGHWQSVDSELADQAKSLLNEIVNDGVEAHKVDVYLDQAGNLEMMTFDEWGKR